MTSTITHCPRCMEEAEFDELIKFRNVWLCSSCYVLANLEDQDESELELEELDFD